MCWCVDLLMGGLRLWGAVIRIAALGWHGVPGAGMCYMEGVTIESV